MAKRQMARAAAQPAKRGKAGNIAKNVLRGKGGAAVAASKVKGTGSKATVMVRAKPAVRRDAGPKAGKVAANKAPATLKERVDQAMNLREPLPTAAELEAVRFAISMPGLLDEVREQAFVELAGVVGRTLAGHGRHLSPVEAANVAWWIVGHPDDVPDA